MLCWGVWCGRCGGPVGWWVGFLALSCVFALAWVLILVGVLPGAYGLAGCGILAKASLVPGRDLAACVLSLVFVWCVLLSQGECWPEMRVQA